MTGEAPPGVPAADDEIDPATLAALLPAAPGLFDVRQADEYARGMLAGARPASVDTIVAAVAALAVAPRAPLVVYCATGRRSALAVARLRAAGYAARSLTGGFVAWQAAGLPWVVPDAAAAFSAAELDRYSRQLRLPEIGLTGQDALRRARVAVVGAGGLGSPVALYLAAAGVGELTLIDGDHVELSNLHRQVLHTTGRLGQPKVTSAAESLAALNPALRIRPVAARLGPDNARAVLANHAVVVEASDNFATRYLVNDVALALRIPVVHAAVQGFEGQVTVVPAGGAPCYRCLFPAPPPPEAAPSCAEAGVLGVVPGLVGLVQAAEVLKHLLRIGDPLVGRLLIIDLLGMRFDELPVAADPGCACAKAQTPDP